MAKYLRYQGEFLSISGDTWRVEMHQEAETPFVVCELEFDAEEPLVIDWPSKAKEEVLCGATATLKIISPGDRTYVDLYSIEVGRVRLDVYRNNRLYWSGCIDAETYEEPYEKLNGYTVTFTFTDFGIFSRLKYGMVGMVSLEDIVNSAINQSGILIGSINTNLVSTYIGESKLALSSLKVRSDNFYDEEGEASTIADVIKGVLQPLGLKMIQRRGQVYIYDLNALYESGPKTTIEWNGDSQRMGVDKVYNNAKITWSPYAQSDNLLPTTCWPTDIKTPVNLSSLNNLEGETSGDATYYSYHYTTDTGEWNSLIDKGFTLWTSPRGDNVEILDNRAKFFKTVPQYDGTDAEGVAVSWRAVTGGLRSDGAGSIEYYYASKEYGINNLIGDIGSGSPIFKSREIWVPPVSNPDELLIHLKMEMLLDVRFNPFENATNLKEGPKQKNNAEKFDKYGNFVYLPVRVKFQPDGSDEIYTWDNQTIINNSGYRYDIGDWKTEGVGYLAYYDTSDLENKCGVLGWKANRQALSPTTQELFTRELKADDGQTIRYPLNGGGKLWVEVYNDGWRVIDRGETFSGAPNDDKKLFQNLYWTLLKLPEVKIINNTQFGQDISQEDIEYAGELNASAKDSIELNTICGTAEEDIPTARGAYFDALTNAQIKALSRAQRTSQVEDLLIGTLYSQYAQRRTTLSGEAELLANTMGVYAENNQQGKIFICVEDVQNVRMNTSDATFIELRPDEYKRENE